MPKKFSLLETSVVSSLPSYYFLEGERYNFVFKLCKKNRKKREIQSFNKREADV